METSKLEKIILPNRDGAKLYLVKIDDNLYKLECDQNHKYVLDYACITLCEDNVTIQAFDPPGGPFLNLGYKVDDTRTIKSIIPIEGEIVFLIN